MKNVTMTFCLIVAIVFIWVWHHQIQFNDHSRQALFHMKNGELDDAIEAYTQAITHKKYTIFFANEPSAYNNLGQAYLRKGEYEPAITAFKKTIEMKPDAVQAYVNLATVFLKQNRLDLAIASCQNAIRIAPNSALAHYNLACVYALMGEEKPAIESLKRALDLSTEIREFAQEESAFDNLRTHPLFPSQ
ncbi:MAG: tetratricopeptide repeat protein [Candidatus Poribacteria bacterium]